MLDVRPTAYVIPVAEQPQASLTPTIRIQNAGDENAIVSGLVRIYRTSTGLQLYASELAATSLAHGVTADVAALTPWDPPAPADDDYFITCNVHAVSHPPEGWHTQDTSLGAWTFDVKTPPMGPAPAGHKATHELGGSDELDVTGLVGAGGGAPAAHAASHENAGADEISAAGLSGLLADEQTPLAHYHDKHLGLFFISDIPTTAGTPTQPWSGLNISSGALLHTNGETNHPGIWQVNSSTSANSGAMIGTSNAAIMLAGGEHSDFIINLSAIAGTTVRLGFHDSQSSADAVDGAYIEITQVGGVDGTAVGKTSNNSARSTTATSYVLSISTWYRLRIETNADATLVTFTIMNAAGAILWTDTLNSNIPTARTTGNGIVCTNSGTSAIALAIIDYLDMAIDRVLTR